MVAVTVSFPCFSSTGEARPVSAPDLWEIARNVRQQLCGGLWPKPLAAETITGRVERLVVNGTRLMPSWDCQHAVHDDEGRPVMGVCEYDPDSPGSVMLSLNAAVVGLRPDLAASTAAHELGHAIFDMPAAMIACRRSDDGTGHRVFRHVTPDEGHFHAAGPKDAVFWSEFRANEFMGGLLAPPDLLHRAMVIRAGELGLPMTPGAVRAGKPGYPVLMGSREEDQVLLHDLSETFGVSPGFIAVRLRKYGLMRESM